VSEKSTRNDLDYAFKSRTARNRSVFRPQLRRWSSHTAEEPYNLSESGLKKEIPVKGQALADEQARYDQAVADHSGPSWGRGWAASMPFSAAAAASWHAGKRETK
jgi:hypothetical protein